MKRRNACLFINLFVCFLSKGQIVHTALSPAKSNAFYDTAKQTASAQIFMKKSPVYRFGNTPIKTVPSGFYYNSLGFFCKKELQVQKALRFPVKVRLGSVAYTDQMEGKGVSLPANRK